MEEACQKAVFQQEPEQLQQVTRAQRMGQAQQAINLEVDGVIIHRSRSETYMRRAVNFALRFYMILYFLQKIQENRLHLISTAYMKFHSLCLLMRRGM